VSDDREACEHPEREHVMAMHSEPVVGGMRYENTEHVYCKHCRVELGRRIIR